MSARCSSRKTGLQISPSKQTHELGYGIRIPGARSAGVMELRIWDEAGTFRVVYVAKFEDAVYVLHCFQKKTQTTAQRDIELARKRFKALVKEISK
jgi:phage-related protein